MASSRRGQRGPSRFAISRQKASPKRASGRYQRESVLQPLGVALAGHRLGDAAQHALDPRPQGAHADRRQRLGVRAEVEGARPLGPQDHGVRDLGPVVILGRHPEDGDGRLARRLPARRPSAPSPGSSPGCRAGRRGGPAAGRRRPRGLAGRRGARRAGRRPDGHSRGWPRRGPPPARAGRSPRAWWWARDGRASEPRKRRGSSRSRSRPASHAEGSGASRCAAARSTCRRAWRSGGLVTGEDEALAVTRVRVSLEIAVEPGAIISRPAPASPAAG